MRKKAVPFLGQPLMSLKGFVRNSLLLVLLLLLSGCLLGREGGEVTAPAEDPPQSPPISETPAGPTLETIPFTPTLPPSSTPTAPETQVEPPVTSLLDEDLPLSPRAYVLPLVVRSVLAGQATLFFELDEPADGDLIYQAISPERQAAQAIALTAGETRQQITIEDLVPGTEYRAIVALKDGDGTPQQPAFLGEPWGSVRFRTVSGQEPLRVGVFGDASFGDPATEALVQVMASYNLDFVIHTGDVVAEIQDNNGPAEAYALKFYKTLSPLLHQLPIYTVIGNHDYDSPARWEGSYFYYYAFPPFPFPGFSQPKNDTQYYAIAYNGVQFLMLDSQVIFGVSGREEEEAWMAERLADPNFRFTIPVFHVPPFFSGSVHPDDQLPVRQLWHPRFVAAHVPLAFSGHSHHYERLLADGITYIVTGGGSGTLYAPGNILPESQIFARRTHFVLMELYSDRIELSAIEKEREIIDQAVIPLQ